MKLRLIFSKIPHIFNLTGNLLESVSLGSAYFAGRIVYRKSTVLITGQYNEMSGRGKNTRSHAADDRTADRKYIDHGIFIQPENASAEPKMLYTIGHQFPFSVQIFIQIAIGTCIICTTAGVMEASCKRPLITMERAVGPHPLTAMIVSEP